MSIAFATCACCGVSPVKCAIPPFNPKVTGLAAGALDAPVTVAAPGLATLAVLLARPLPSVTDVALPRVALFALQVIVALETGAPSLVSSTTSGADGVLVVNDCASPDTIRSVALATAVEVALKVTLAPPGTVTCT